MKKMCLAGLTIVIVALFALSASAQPGPGGPGGMRGGPGGPGGMRGGPGGEMDGITQLFRNEEIKSKLGLSTEQEEKLTSLLEKNRESMRERFRGGRQGGERSGPPSREDMEKMRAEVEKMRAEIKEKANQILTPEQQEKVKVLRFQISGGLDSPMINPESLEALNLTDKQKAELKAMDEARREAFRTAMENRPRVDFRTMSEEDRRKAFEEMRTQGEARSKEFKEKVLSLLTPDQKAKAEQLSSEGKELREKVMQQMQERRDERRGDRGRGQGGPEGEFRPGADSWRPGQGAQKDNAGGEKSKRRTFPKAEEDKAE